jgi:hypothetical protein
MGTRFRLRLTLLSDTTFGRGDGVPGEVDAEVQHDDAGLPYLGGRALRGMLNDECSDLLFALGGEQRWQQAALALFGSYGSTHEECGGLIVGDATLPADLRDAVRADVAGKKLTREAVLDSLTVIRQQTAVDPGTGAPQRETLRAMRVIIRGIAFESQLHLLLRAADEPLALPLLAACVKALRRVGTGRNRGRGEVDARLLDDSGGDVTAQHFGSFADFVSANQGAGGGIQ